MLLWPLLMLVVLITALGWFAATRDGSGAGTVALFWLAGAGLVASAVATWGYLLKGHYMMMALPGGCLLLALGVHELFRLASASRRLRLLTRAMVVCAVGMLGYWSLGATAYVVYIAPLEQDLRGMFRWVEMVMLDNDRVVAQSWFCSGVMARYAGDRTSRAIPALPEKTLANGGQILSATPGRLWILYGEHWIPPDYSAWMGSQKTVYEFPFTGNFGRVFLIWPRTSSDTWEQRQFQIRYALEQATIYYPKQHPRILLALGQLDREAGASESAVAYCERAARLVWPTLLVAPTSATLWNLLADAYAGANHVEAASRCYGIAAYLCDLQSERRGLLRKGSQIGR